MDRFLAEQAGLLLVDWGVQEYETVLGWQRRWFERSVWDEELPSVILMGQHEPVVTVGRGTRQVQALEGLGVPVVEVERGGQVTWHGPGQVVVYPLLRLRHEARVTEGYLAWLEAMGQAVLREVGLEPEEQPEARGVWVKGAEGVKKVGSVGVAVKRWRSLHGLALSVGRGGKPPVGLVTCGLASDVYSSVAEELGLADAGEVELMGRVSDFLQNSWLPEQMGLEAINKPGVGGWLESLEKRNPLP